MLLTQGVGGVRFPGRREGAGRGTTRKPAEQDRGNETPHPGGGGPPVPTATRYADAEWLRQSVRGEAEFRLRDVSQNQFLELKRCAVVLPVADPRGPLRTP